MARDSFEEMVREEQRMAEMREAQNAGTNSGKKKADGMMSLWMFIIFGALIILLLIFGKSENPKGMGVCLFLMGACVAALPIVKRSVMLKRCTERVMATCIHLDVRRSRGSNGHTTTTYAPQWEYSFGGNVYQHQEKNHSNIGVPKIGGEYELFVNPEDPEEIYRKDLKGSIFQFIFGLVFALAGVLAILQRN